MGLFDESIVIDSPFLSWIHPFLRTLQEGRRGHQGLWPFSHAELGDTFRNLVKQLGLQELNSSLYCLRHGGASHDILHRYRPMAEVKVRGRWQADASTKRYLKASRAQAELAKLPLPVAALGKEVEASLEQLFHRPSLAAQLLRKHGIM